MKSKLITVLISAFALCSGAFLQAQDRMAGEFRRAVDLYDHGMFERAGTIFSGIAAESDDVMAKGYETLCAIRLQEKGYETKVSDYLSNYPYSKLIPQVRFYNALNSFDKEDFKAAAT
ncbi:MAG: hypothetical protein J6N46_08260, partial [Bacteroidales bacterium]|nr:hypothetical protein [Bacteroidales bacterium]